jgi:hypothetical protein
MPDCRYIVLNYHATETSETGHPLVLLLEYIADNGSKQRKSYLLSDLSVIVGDVHLGVRDWLISALAEISQEQLHFNSDSGELFLWYSFLNIGPLRTAVSGHFACGSLSEAFAVIKERVMVKASRSPGGECFPDFLFPLDRSVLRSIVDFQRVFLN